MTHQQRLELLALGLGRRAEETLVGAWLPRQTHPNCIVVGWTSRGS